jgi:hypothetical protein
LRICCLIPALPSEVRLATLQSIFSQSVAVDCTVLLTKKAPDKLSFPAKISWVLNDMLDSLKLETFDFLWRLDADTVVPNNFLEATLAMGCDVVGYGPSQLIRVSAFLKCMNGRFHPDHDDGYPLVKFAQCGFKVSDTYVVEPKIIRAPGFHHGASWFLSQGELHYRYGHDVIHEFVDFLFKFRSYHPYGIFIFCGYLRGLLLHRGLFDVAGAIRWGHLGLYRRPKRFLKIGFYGNLYITKRGKNLE